MKGIEDRIFTVELYAGLCEDVECIRDGEPASNDDKVHLFQRRHYMDEECLVDYSSGGMEFKNIRQFDRWLMRKANRTRILPLPKCVVAFQVRRGRKGREAQSFTDFISFIGLEDADKLTFLYIRNGDRYYRMSTDIDFGPQLFPDVEKSNILHGALYTDPSWGKIISESDYQEHVAAEKEAKKKYKREVAAWKKKTKSQKARESEPWYHGPSANKYEPLTPESVQFDDGMAKVADMARAHNRIAIVLQGLLDRSPVFHPHPPWKLWTPEGFSSGIELLYDDSRAISVGDTPDFEAYRDRLNVFITRGTNTVGQYKMWTRAEAVKENTRQENDYRVRGVLHYDYFRPNGNPGPGLIAKVVSLSRDKTKCGYKWERDRERARWVSDPERIGWMKKDWSMVAVHFRCAKKSLINVDAYTKGDYKQFYKDPRTRADYLKWAPLLLAAEDFLSKKKK